MGFGTADYNVVDQIFVNAPLQLGVGDPAVPFDFITVTIPIPFASGSYFGTLMLQGGPHGPDDQDVIGTGAFEVSACRRSGGSPGPGSLFRFGTALVWLRAVGPSAPAPEVPLIGRATLAGLPRPQFRTPSSRIRTPSRAPAAQDRWFFPGIAMAPGLPTVSAW